MKQQSPKLIKECPEISFSRRNAKARQIYFRVTPQEFQQLKAESSGNVSSLVRRRLGLSRSNCRECNFPLPIFARSDSVFCSPKCKQRFWRKNTPAQNLCLNHTRQYHELYGCEKKAENNDTAVTGNQRSDLE